MDIPSAEMTKYAANAMLATRISFMNEIANLCERVGRQRRPRAQGHRQRRAHRAGVPVPGPRLRRLLLPEGREGAHAHAATSAARRCEILTSVEEVNDRQKRRLFDKLAGAAGRWARAARAWRCGGWRSSRNTDDMREAPALTLIEALLAAGARVTAHDPVAMPEARAAARRPGRVRRDRATTRSTAATRSWWSPTGTSTGTRTSRGCKQLLKRPSSSTAATCTTRQDARARLHVRVDRSGAGDRAVRVADHRRRRLPRLAPLRPLPGRRPHAWSGSTTSSPGTRDNIAHLMGDVAVQFIRHDISDLHLRARPGRRRAALRLAGEPGRLPRAADPDAEGRLARARTTRSGWPRPRARGSSSPRRRRCTATRWCIRRTRPTGAT